LSDFYKSEAEKLPYFKPTPSANHKWQLGSQLTEDDMCKFLTVVKAVADKIIGKSTRKQVIAGGSTCTLRLLCVVAIA